MALVDIPRQNVGSHRTSVKEMICSALELIDRKRFGTSASAVPYSRRFINS